MGRVWRKAVDGSAPWARDNIAWSCVMAISPAVAVAILSRAGRADFGVVWLTLWLYAGAFVFYCGYRLTRAAFGVRKEDREDALAQAALLWTFEAQARELLLQLEQVWHHWHNAGDSLLRPLDTNDAKSADSLRLQMELRDFKVTYGKHLQRLALDVPTFTSKSLAGDYPSSREYIEVLHDLREHASTLDEAAQKLYATGKPLR